MHSELHEDLVPERTTQEPRPYGHNDGIYPVALDDRRNQRPLIDHRIPLTPAPPLPHFGVLVYAHKKRK